MAAQLPKVFMFSEPNSLASSRENQQIGRLSAAMRCDATPPSEDLVVLRKKFRWINCIRGQYNRDIRAGNVPGATDSEGDLDTTTHGSGCFIVIIDRTGRRGGGGVGGIVRSPLGFFS